MEGVASGESSRHLCKNLFLSFCRVPAKIFKNPRGWRLESGCERVQKRKEVWSGGVRSGFSFLGFLCWEAGEQSVGVSCSFFFCKNIGRKLRTVVHIRLEIVCFEPFPQF